MKKLLFVAVLFAFAIAVSGLAYAEGPATTPPPPTTQPPPPPPPPAVEKVVKITLTPGQMKVLKAATAAADVTLTKSQLVHIHKEWKDFKGTAAKVLFANVYNAKQVDVTLKDGALISATHVAPPPPPPPPAKDKGKK